MKTNNDSFKGNKVHTDSDNITKTTASNLEITLGDISGASYNIARIELLNANIIM